jgi:hypothetical protein
MNRKKSKLLFIRSKNKMYREGFLSPKWILTNHKWPTLWKYTNPNILEDCYVCDMRRYVDRSR